MEENSMLLKAYPAIFTPEEEGGYLIEFPDVQDAYTGIHEEEGVAFGISMAEEVLGLSLAGCIEGDDLTPAPSDINDIIVPAGGFVTMVKIDLEEYLLDGEHVEITLTIPKWVNELGNRCGVNFSKLLTKAIIAENLNKK